MLEATPQTPSDGSQAQPTAGTTATPEAAAFDQYYATKVKPEIDRLKAENHGLSTKLGRTEAQLKATKEMSDEDYKTFTQAFGTYEGRVTTWAKQGVPQWLLDSAQPTKLDEVAEKYLAERGKAPALESASTKSSTPAGDSYADYLAWKAQASALPSGGGATGERMVNGTGQALRPTPVGEKLSRAVSDNLPLSEQIKLRDQSRAERNALLR